MQFELKGWQAVVAVVVVIAVGMLRFSSQTKALETQGERALTEWLVLEAARGAMPEMTAALEDPSTDEKDVAAMMDRFAAERFEILDVTRSGLGDEPVARVEIRDRDDGDTHVRYFRMRYGMAMGWRVMRETDALGFYLNAL